MPSNARPSFELPLLLLGAFRTLIDELHQALAENGHGEARPLHGFALQAIGPDGITVSDLGRRLGVSKQAAAKTAAALERAGYICRERDTEDARALRLQRTPHGLEMLSLSAKFFESYHKRLSKTLGRQRLAQLEDDLHQMTDSPWQSLPGLQGWIT